MDLQMILLIAALAVTIVLLGGYSLFLRAGIKGLEQRRDALRRDNASHGGTAPSEATDTQPSAPEPQASERR